MQTNRIMLSNEKGIYIVGNDLLWRVTKSLYTSKEVGENLKF
jgi:hypothetical protein